MVFLNLPETREERVRRDEREKIRREIKEKARQEVERKLMKEREKVERAERAVFASWYARIREAQAKGEPFDEPFPLSKPFPWE